MGLSGSDGERPLLAATGSPLRNEGPEATPQAVNEPCNTALGRSNQMVLFFHRATSME